MNYHKQPENKQEYQAWLNKVTEQSMQIKEHEPITCICGLQLEAEYMFRCYYCGLWLCNTCSEKHFGKRPEGEYNYKQYFSEAE